MQQENEHTVYAVYSRTGPRKILMLLTPRLRKVIYTPLGVEFFGFNRNKLPPYELATNLIAQDSPGFVLLPYIKGRSVQEIEQLILETQPQPEYEIKDITLGEIYTGVYGKLEPVSKSLQSVTSCQTHQHIILGQAPKGTPVYQQFIRIADTFDAIMDGMMMVGKNSDYIITSSLDFYKILDDIRKCGRVYYLIAVRKDLMEFGKVTETSHAMVIVIDPQTKILEVFDPNGISPDTRHVYFWATKVANFLREHNIQVERRITADEPFCPQGVSSFASEFKDEQQCLVWAFWYIWLRVNNPMVPAEVIHRYMAKMAPQEAFDKVRRIASIAFGS